MTTALVIDDNRNTADSLCMLLTLFDLKTQAAYGPRAAFISLHDLVPDIIFLDVNMPGVTGFEVIAYLRREPRLANIPVVIVTSDDQAETTRRAKEEGAMCVIIKPATVEALESALQKAKLI